MAITTNTTTLEIIENETPIAVGGVSTIGEFGFGEASEVDVTRLNETGGYKRFVAGLKDAGTVTIGGFKEAADAGQAKVIELHGSGATADFKITYPDGATAAFSGFVKKFMFAEMAVDAALAWSVDVRISGGVTYTEAS